MRAILIISLAVSVYAFFAPAKAYPSWVHTLNAQGYDKHAHALIFFLLEVLCVCVFRNYTPLSIAAFLAGIGVLIEVLQHHSHRTGDILDVFSNCAGLFFALIFIQLFNKFLNFSL